MVLAEAPRLYPVFTHHAKELKAASRYLSRRMEQYARTGKPDDKFNALLDRYSEVIQTFLRMQRSKAPYVYLTQEERELVTRVNTWLKDHPENRIA